MPKSPRPRPRNGPTPTAAISVLFCFLWFGYALFLWSSEHGPELVALPQQQSVWQDAHLWAWHLVRAWVGSLGGESGVLLLLWTLLSAALASLAHWFQGRGVHWTVALALPTLLASALLPLLPLGSWVFSVVGLLWIARFVEDPKRAWITLPLFVLWGNLDPGVWYGVLILFVVAMSATFLREPLARGFVRELWFATGFCVAALFVAPPGHGALQVLSSLLRAPDFSGLSFDPLRWLLVSDRPAMVLITLLVPMALLGGRNLRRHELLVGALLTFAALLDRSHLLPLVGFFIPLLFLRVLSRMFLLRPLRLARGGKGWWIPLASLAVIAFLMLQPAAIGTPSDASAFKKARSLLPAPFSSTQAPDEPANSK